MVDLPDIKIEKVVEKFVNDLSDDPQKALVGVDRSLNMITDLLPTTPDEFPLPVPQGVYRKLNLGRFVKKLP